MAGAGYAVSDAGGAVLATGRLNGAGKARANIPLAASHVQVRYFDDPLQVAILKQSLPKPVPATPGWFDRMAFALKETWQVTKDGAQWTWGVIEGDFNENQSVGQIITNAAVTAIPGIDQAGDARDIAAAIKLMAWDRRHKELGTWFMLAATIIGLVPIAGSLAKGVLKLIWKGARLDKVVAVFNHFAKGNAVKYLKALKAGKLKSLMNDAASEAHKIVASIIDKLKVLKGYIPRKFTWLNDQMSETLDNLTTIRALIDEKFAQMTEVLTRNLDRMLTERLDNVQAVSSRTLLQHQQKAQPIEKIGDSVEIKYNGRGDGNGPEKTPDFKKNPDNVKKKKDANVHNFKSPSKRHKLKKVTQRTMAKRMNTVIEPNIDVAADVAAINKGLAKKVGDKFVINGRTYGMHDGNLYPISGMGFHQLDRPAFKALGVLNKFGDSARANQIINNMGLGEKAKKAALNTWRAVQ